MKNRTRHAPFLPDTLRPIGPDWRWVISLHVGTHGYVTSAHVTAMHRVNTPEQLIGSAQRVTTYDDDVQQVLEDLVVEAMLASVAAESTVRGPGRISTGF